MAKVLILFVLCVLPALISATRPVKDPFLVSGRVYCDTCRCGFETTASTYIQGAKVRIECKDRDSLALAFSQEGVTDATGTYHITVNEDHQDHLCEAVLVSSPYGSCSKVVPGRERARVILTNNNGINSNKRFANNLGFERDEPLAGCTQLLKQYFPDDESF